MSNDTTDAGAIAAAPAAIAHQPARERVPELDSLRGLAALGVLALHTLQPWFFWGWSCVDLFFILSGYLISSILLANAQTPRMLFSFYVRRALRIWPVYFLTWIAATLIYLLIEHGKTGAWPDIPGAHWLSLVFLQYLDRYTRPAAPLPDIWYFSHSWSLASEEQFYLLWPLLFFLLRPRLRMVYVVGAALLAGAALMRARSFDFHLMLTRVDGLVFGIVLAYLGSDRYSWFYRVRPRWFLLGALAGLLMLLPYLMSHQAQNLVMHAPRRALEVTAFCLLYASLIAATIRSSGAAMLAPLRHPLLVHCGRISFAIYMYQMPIGYLLLEAHEHALIGTSAMYLMVWVLTLGAAHLSYLYLEGPVLALKARFPYRKA